MALSPEEDAKSKAAAANAPWIQPWQVNVVMSSLPYLADRETIKKTLEEHKGNIDLAVSSLLDAEDRASVSSQNGSSSTERDRDSDDEQFSGPSKKQDRRLSKATKAMQKDKADREARETGSNQILKQEPANASSGLSESTTATQLRKIAPRSVRRVKKQEADDDGWTTSDGEFRPDSQADSDAASDYSTPSSQAPTEPSVKPATRPTIKITFTQGTGKTAQKQPGPPKPQRVPARVAQAQKKQEQKARAKAARKERSMTAAQRELAPASANSKNLPPIDLGIGIKTLYI